MRNINANVRNPNAFSGQGQSMDGRQVMGGAQPVQAVNQSNAIPQPTTAPVNGAMGQQQNNAAAGIGNTAASVGDIFSGMGMPMVGAALTAGGAALTGIANTQDRFTHYSYNGMAGDVNIGNNFKSWTKQPGLINSIASIFTNYNED